MFKNGVIDRYMYMHRLLNWICSLAYLNVGYCDPPKLGRCFKFLVLNILQPHSQNGVFKTYCNLNVSESSLNSDENCFYVL